MALLISTGINPKAEGFLWVFSGFSLRSKVELLTPWGARSLSSKILTKSYIQKSPE
jgi:hypothetical protein